MNALHDMGRPGRVDLNLFRIFDVTYREGNLTRAAAELCMSQSAVSHALARLRKQLDDPLFVRMGQGVVPTPLAHRLAPDIHAALGLFQQTLERNRQFDPRRNLTRMTLAMHDEIEAALLPEIVRHMREQAPAARVSSVRLERGTLRTDLAAGRLDVAIDVAQAADPELLHRALLSNDFCVVSRGGKAPDVRRYLDAEHVTVSSRRSGAGVEDLLLERLGYQRRVAVRCQHYESACRIVARSDLLLTMPRRHAEAMNAVLGNKIHPVPLPLPPIELRLYWHRQADEDPANRWLRHQLLELAKRLA